jgi:hypothetical protein
VLALAALAALPAAPASAEEPLEVAGGALPGAQPAPELPAQRARGELVRARGARADREGGMLRLRAGRRAHGAVTVTAGRL